MKLNKTSDLALLLAVMFVGLANVSAEEKFDTNREHKLPRPATKAADMKKPVKVFILMGQSNMVGMRDVSPAEKRNA